jgi:hypothetical protein
MELNLRSSAFEADDTIPEKYTCEGENVSPPLSWTGVPDEAESLVVICDDPDAPNGTFSHWVLYNLPPGTKALPEDYPAGERPAPGVLQGRNDFGNVGYGGPCPPVGDSPHRYYFRLYALDTELDAGAGLTRLQVLDLAQDHILVETALIGRFGRSVTGS